MVKKRFEYLSHTADVSFIAYGKDFKETLENAALALLNLMLDTRKIKALHSQKAEVKMEDSAYTEEDLAWYLLQDIASRVDAEKLNAYDFKLLWISEAKGKISARGTLFYKKSPENFALLSVKAVTPHGLAINQIKGGYSISVVADV